MALFMSLTAFIALGLMDMTLMTLAQYNRSSASRIQDRVRSLLNCRRVVSLNCRRVVSRMKQMTMVL